MNTAQKISTITPEQISARLDAANARYMSAANDMIARSYKRGDGPVVPSDMPALDLPPIPDMPAAIRRILSDVPSGWDSSSALSAVHRDQLRYKRGDYGWQITHRTPQELVAAIRAADEMASIAERLAAEYRDATAAAIVAHVATQEPAVRELAGLVAQA